MMIKYIEQEKAVDAVFSANGLGNSTFRDVHDVVDRLRLIPAADVMEVRHGEWRDFADKIDKLFHRHDFFCEKCHARADYFIGGEGNWWSSCAPNYCPNCGAKMKEVRNNGV